MKVLVACEESQAVCIAFREKGHEAYSCDVQECSGGHPEWHIQGDVLEQLDKGWDMMIAHPPCTRLSNSGVRWLHNPPVGKTMKQIWDELDQACEFYCELRLALIPKIAIENPIMHRYASARIWPYGSKHYRHIIQPWMFGERAFKATGFELIGLPPLAPTNVLEIPEKGTEEHKAWSFIHRMAKSADRPKLRSKTFPGIAKAMAEQWGSL